jgi:hypothetical protein
MQTNKELSSPNLATTILITKKGEVNMKAYLINPTLKTIVPVNYSGNFWDIYN